MTREETISERKHTQGPWKATKLHNITWIIDSPNEQIGRISIEAKNIAVNN